MTTTSTLSLQKMEPFIDAQNPTKSSTLTTISDMQVPFTKLEVTLSGLIFSSRVHLIGLVGFGTGKMIKYDPFTRPNLC